VNAIAVRGVEIPGLRPASRAADEPECREIHDLVRAIVPEAPEGKGMPGLTVFLNAMQLFGDCGGKSDVPLLVSMLKDDNFQRVAALQALRSIGPDAAEALPALEALSGKLSPGVQMSLDETLKPIRSRRN
jgi:hypothetical protein